MCAVFLSLAVCNSCNGLKPSLEDYPGFIRKHKVRESHFCRLVMQSVLQKIKALATGRKIGGTEESGEIDF